MFFIILVTLVLLFNLYLLYYSRKKNYLLIVWRGVVFVVSIIFLFISFFYINRFENNNFDSENNWSIYLDIDNNYLPKNENILNELLSSALIIETVFNELKYNSSSKIKENLLPLAQSIKSNIKQKCPTDTINKYLHIENNIVISYDDKTSKVVINIIIDGDNEFSISESNSVFTALTILKEIFDKKDISNLKIDLNHNENIEKRKRYLLRYLTKSDKNLSKEIFDKNEDYTSLEINDFFKRIKDDKENNYKINRLTNLYDYLKSNKILEVTNQSINTFNQFQYLLLSAEIALFLEEYDFTYNSISNRLSNAYKLDKKLNSIEPEILYLLSKFSQNRFSEFGFESKQKIVEFAFENINLNTNLLHNLAFDFLYNYDRFTIYKAEECFKILSKIYPSDVKYIAELAFASRLLNKMDRSLELLANAIELEPTNWYYLYSYGTGLYVRDQKKAKDIFLEAIEMGDSLNSNLYLGKIYYDEEDYEEALFYYRERVRHSFGVNDEFKLQALKGIRRSLKKIDEKSESKIDINDSRKN